MLTEDAGSAERGSSSASCSSSEDAAAAAAAAAERAADELSFREDQRFQTWRKHTRDVYRLAMHFEPVWPCRTLQFLPYMTRDPQDAQHATQTVIAGTTTDGAEQCFLKLMTLDLPTGPQPPPGCSTAVDPELGEIGGYGFAPRYVSLAVQARFYHDGDVVRARYMPANPNIFLTASTTGSLYLFDYARLLRSSAPNWPPRPQLPPPPLADDSVQSERDQAAYRRAEEEQERWDRAMQGPGQHRVRLAPPSPSPSPSQNANANANMTPTSCEWHHFDNAGTCCGGYTSGAVAVWSLGSAQSVAAVAEHTAAEKAPPAAPAPKGAPAAAKRAAAVTLQPTSVWRCPAAVSDVQYSAVDANVLAASCTDGTTRVWDVRASGGSSSSPSSSPQAENQDASSSSSASQLIFDAPKSPTEGCRAACSVAWSLFEANICAVGYGSGVTRIWDTRNTRQPVAAFASHNHRNGVAAFLDDADSDGAAGAKKDPTRVCDVTCLQWNPHDRAAIATGGEDGNVTWVDVKRGKCMFVHCGHTQAINDMSWSWQDAFAGLMVSADDKAVIAWSPRTHLLE